MLKSGKRSDTREEIEKGEGREARGKMQHATKMEGMQLV
jgi:hypothetical protein